MLYRLDGALPLDFGTKFRAQERTTLRVLVFTRTAGFRHESFDVRIALVRSLGAENGFEVDATEEAGAFNNSNLSRYHPISWSHAIDGGRAWYTNIGHSVETYTNPAFEQHLLGGILWVAAGM